ncbi:hypothetical protein [Thomasclavelia cocleata]|uniref:hypothetical protein n=1 Tax=Thomasclavelia cocleata TaxID=69824 RepID=UPI002615E43F|nr:hypothetical protein [Thomasclavelia cocleata]
MMAPRTGRPKSDNPRDINTRIRMTKDESKMLQECSDKLGISKTDVVIKGIKKVHDELEKG